MNDEKSAAKTQEVMGGSGAVLEAEIERADSAARAGMRVILVEGTSDQLAVETLALRRGRALEREGIAVIPTAGVTNLNRFLDLLGPGGHDVQLAGFCDQPEETRLRLGLERAGIATALDRDTMERVGFYVCVRDLEDELVRALGADRMLGIMEMQGHLRRFRSFQNQPAQSHKRIEDQIWRWLGNHKIRYASLMVEALDLDQVPRPLDGVLSSV
jgi:hypothetical protein